MAFPQDRSRLTESVRVEDGYAAVQPIQWRCVTEVEDHYLAAHGDHQPGDVVRQVVYGNVLVNRGGTLLFKRLTTLKPSTSATGAALQAYSSGTSRIGVGISTAAAAVTQTALSGTAPAYQGMSSGYPITSTAASTAARTGIFRALFSTAQANFPWNEWALFNSTVAARSMLNRKVQSLGTKTSAATRQITVTLSLA